MGSEPSPYLIFGNPPRVSDLYMPEHLANTSGLPVPDPEGDVVRLLAGQACSASQDGLLLLSCYDICVTASLLAKQGGNKVRQLTGLADPDRVPDIAHAVFNPLTGQLSRLPAIQGLRKILPGFHLGILTQTQADGGRGPLDRNAVAELEGHLMLRFLSETGEWEIMEGSPSQLPAVQRRLVPNQEVLAFGGRLWWVDVTWGAICADPFSDRPEPHFVELPSGSVLPADTYKEAFRRGNQLPDAEGNVWWMKAPAMYRRVGVSGRWLWYVEVSQEEPFMLSSFALKEDGSGWTMEHWVALSQLWADGGHPWLPLQGKTPPQIGVLDPGKPNVVHLIVSEHIVVVDMHKGDVIRHCPLEADICILPCMISPWLPTTRIPSAASAMPMPPLPCAVQG